MKFSAHSIEFNFIYTNSGTAMPAAVTIGSLTATDHPINPETRGDDGGGLYDNLRTLVSQMPEITYSTKVIPEVLKLTGPNGICFHDDVTHPGITLYGQLIDECSNPLSADDMSLIIPRGLLRPTTLTVDRSDDAVLEFTIDALSDGTKDPIEPAYGVTLPAAVIVEKYAMGAARLSNQTIDEPRDYNLDFGLVMTEKLPAVGSVWPETVGVRKAQPVLSVNHRDPTLFDDAKIPLLGDTAVSATTIVQFKKRAKLNAFEPDGSNVHFNFIMNGYITHENVFSTAADAAADATLRLEGHFEGGQAPLVFDFDTTYNPTP